MKLKNISPRDAAILGVALILAVVLLSPDRLRDQILESLRKTGWLAVLLFGLGRLALGFTGWPLLAVTAVSLVPSGALKDIGEAAGEIFKGNIGGRDPGTPSGKDPDALCADHGGVQLIAGSTVVCRDGTVK